MKKGVIAVLSTVLGAAAGIGVVSKSMGEKAASLKDMSDKHLALFLMMNQWVKVKQDGKNLSEYFKKNSYQKIAVYGMGYVGETLVNELKTGGIEVAYGIDKNASSIYADIEVLTMEDELAEVDAIVVTAITFFGEIEGELCEKVKCPIISLEDIIYEV